MLVLGINYRRDQSLSKATLKRCADTETSNEGTVRDTSLANCVGRDRFNQSRCMLDYSTALTQLYNLGWTGIFKEMFALLLRKAEFSVGIREQRQV